MWLRSLSLVLFSSAILGNPVSKGAVTETRFIVQNKVANLKKAIKNLKKELTECYTKRTSHLKKHELKSSTVLTPLEDYHCTTKQLLYPYYIEELSEHAKILEKDAHLLTDHTVWSQKAYDEMVKRTFLIAEKVELERKLLDTVFRVDRSTQELATYKNTHRTTWKSDHKTYTLETQIQLDKDACNLYKSRIKEINKTIFTEQYPQKVFLEELPFYSHA